MLSLSLGELAGRTCMKFDFEYDSSAIFIVSSFVVRMILFLVPSFSSCGSIVVDCCLNSLFGV